LLTSATSLTRFTRTRCADLQTEVTQLNARITHLNTEKESYKTKYSSESDRVTNLNGQLSTLRGNLNKVQGAFDASELVATRLHIKLDKLTAQMSTQQDDLVTFRERSKQTAEQIEQATFKLSESTARIEELERSLEQALSEKSELEIRLAQASAKKETLHELTDSLRNDLQSAQDNFASAQASIADWKSAAATAEANLRQAMEEKTRLSEAVSTLQQTVKEQETALKTAQDQMAEAIREHKSQLDVAQAKAGTLSSTMATLEASKKQLEERVETLETGKGQLDPLLCDLLNTFRPSRNLARRLAEGNHRASQITC
jgi:chromosome segregation ATPase